MAEDQLSSENGLNGESQSSHDGDSQNIPREFTVMRAVQSVLSMAILMATLLTLWNPRKLIRQPDLTALLNLQAAVESDEAGSLSGSNQNVAILAGHYLHDSGEVCADGLVEAELNHEIATRVSLTLEDAGYSVDQFPEYDLGLLQYQGGILVAIFSGSCSESPLPESGFKIGTSLTAEHPDIINNLAICLGESYQVRTGLPFSYQIINPDHDAYHIFADIHPDTPAVLIEIGSLKTDRTVILGSTTAVVEGITNGVTCFLDQMAERSQ